MRSQADYVNTNDLPAFLAEKGIGVRSRNSKMVTEFREAFSLPIRGFPQPFEADLELHKKLIAEETAEFLQAVNEKDPVEILDALADLAYVVQGCALDCGFDLDAAFTEVHRSNMSKLMPDGSVHRREDGKVLKGPNFSPPDLRKLAGQ